MRGNLVDNDPYRFDILRLVEKSLSFSDYEAVDLKTKKTVYLRRFFSKSDFQSSPSWSEPFLRLGDHLTSLKNPHITEVYEFGFDEDGAFMLFSPDPLEIITNVFPKGMNTEQFAELAKQVMEGLRYIQSRNFKIVSIQPNTVKVDKSGVKPIYQICDIGMEFVHSLVNETEFKLSEYTFMAPEIFTYGDSTKMSDIYMLGHLLFYYAAGGHPLADKLHRECEEMHTSGNFFVLSEVNRKISKEWSTWVTSLIVYDPLERPSAEEAIASMPS